VQKAVFCWSGGKDSAFALYRLRRERRYEVISLLTTITQDYDRVSMHGVRRALLEQQAQALGMSLTPVYISSAADNEEYETQMQKALLSFKEYGVNACAFGDIFLEDLRRYREDKLAAIGLQAVFPLWREDTSRLAESFIAQGFGAVTTCVDSRLLPASFAGRTFDAGFLRALPRGIDPCGENGEFHSFAYSGPVFRHPIKYRLGERVQRGDFCFCDLLSTRPEGSHN
jgi:uncharacterized protein (TIGR00290 family)